MWETIGIDWNLVYYNLVRMAGAFILALPVAWNRERETRYVGLRTYPLVAIGACAFVLTGESVVTSDTSLARIIYGVITGMGFIGGGAILKEKGTVKGTANAASLWCTGAIGTAVALNRLEIAILLSLAIFLVFTVKSHLPGKL